MRSVLRAAPLLLALVPLAGCNKPAAPAKPPAAAASASNATVLDLPARKAGLWEQTMIRDGAPAMGPIGGKATLCLDAAAAAKISVLGREMGRDMCQQRSLTRGLDGSYTFTSTCKAPNGGVFTSKGTVSGDLSSQYKMHSETDITGAPLDKMNGHHVMEITATWKGPCPPDMKPGDMMIGNGFKVNVAEMAGAAGGGK